MWQFSSLLLENRFPLLQYGTAVREHLLWHVAAPAKADIAVGWGLSGYCCLEDSIIVTFSSFFFLINLNDETPRYLPLLQV